MAKDSNSNIFFLSWQLWQQMTFVLAMSILIVFALGLFKLWHNNRLMHKQEILDEEKRSHLEQMRRTGLPIKRASEIPFGVRAIQKGVEVDGIWISRPASLLGEKEKLVSSPTTTTFAGTESEKRGARTPREALRVDSMDGSTLSATPMSRFNISSRQHGRGSGVNEGLNEDTLRRLEGGGQGRVSTPLSYETYVPTSALQPPRRRASASSESVASGKSYETSSSRGSQRLYMATSHPHQDPVQVQTPRGYVPFQSQQRQQPQQPQQQEPLVSLATVEPTFGPGDLHLNRSSRKVNSGFEILPAGTFGNVMAMGTGEEDMVRRNKLKRKGVE
ncbi:hypothetical protein QBC43DRAFT_356835 [Cladorrhinum sp. PSN259]|nr:hypothetical protein QBC43DRAFT_356835 [Cladorrhinum sp. PSN259]